MYNEIQKCENCRAGLACSEHKYKKSREFIEKKKVIPDKTPKKTNVMNKRT